MHIQPFRVHSFRRWSTKSQTDGDSSRRQLADALDYCHLKNWTLDESLVDAGRSAYRGKHMIEGGALGRFFDQVQSGHVKPGDKLIFEGFDRFSRQPPSIALPLFLRLIRAEIEIHVINASQVFNLANIDTDQGLLYGILSAMWGAHMESVNKGKKIKSAWTKRRDAHTAICPAWMKPNADRSAYELIPACVAVIERIYRLALNGHGVDTIVRILNTEQVPAFNGSDKGWFHFYVRLLLTSRRVLGEAEFKTWTVTKDGRARGIKTGEIRKIYPAAITRELFDQVQAIRRKVNQGRNADKMANLFSGGLARCVCGSVMRFTVKGSNNTYRYLTCDRAKRGHAKKDQKICPYHKLHRYEPVEDFVLSAFGMLAYGDVADDGISEFQLHILKAQQDADDIESRYTKLAEAVEGARGASAAKRLAKLEADHTAALARIDSLRREYAGLQAKPVSIRLDDVKALIEGLPSTRGPERIAARYRINAGLRDFIDCLVFNDEHPTNFGMMPEGQGWYIRFTQHLPRGLSPTGQGWLLMAARAIQAGAEPYIDGDNVIIKAKIPIR